MDFTNLFLILAGIVAVAAVVVLVMIFWQKAKERVAGGTDDDETETDETETDETETDDEIVKGLAKKSGEKFDSFVETSTDKVLCVFKKETHELYVPVDEVTWRTGTTCHTKYGTFKISGTSLVFNPNDKEVTVS